MKKITSIKFEESVLIPARVLFDGSPLFSRYVGGVNGNFENTSTRTHIIIFNCEDVKDIPSTVGLQIKSIEESIAENTDNTKPFIAQKNFFSNLKKEIEDPLLRHDAPEGLIAFLSLLGLHELKLNKEKVIFISGVSSITEV